MTGVFNIPAGVKVNVNLWYPLQLTAGAEYVINICKLKTKDVNYEDVENYIYEPLGAKRDGFNIYAGLRICF